ncbi:MAG: anthranilate synthase component I [Endomicrobiales bacterium]
MNNQIYPSLPQFKKLAAKGNLIPVYREILADLETPVSTFLKLAADSPYAYLLESVEGGERWGRYSFISWAPERVFLSRGNEFCIFTPGETPAWKQTKDPLSELKAVMSAFQPVEIEGLPRFWGGAVGYASYDMVRFFERLPDRPEDTLNVPLACYLLTNRLVIFDHLSHTVKIVICVDLSRNKDIERAYRSAEREIKEIVSSLRRPLAVKTKAAQKAKALVANMTPAGYRRKVEKAKEYIRAGDIVQAVISQRFSRPTGARAFDIYRSLRLVNPSPYMYFLRLGDFDLVGSSPEILVRKEEDLAETRPIAGTRPRGKTEEEENRLALELLADPKERAEHIMLVDLGRNDLARVCLPATVRVPQLMTIEKYSHVMHIVSSVKGKLKPGLDAYELFRACFPAGTVSGAPKVRAMEIIDELEPTARGPYAGAVGYFSYSGNMDMAITIRTIVLKDRVAHAQVGAGIVADSVPENEFQETRNKVAALFMAIDRAEEGVF